MDQRFDKPVRIALGLAQNVIYTVEEVERAADLLSYEWPVRTGRRYTEARRACILAAEGQITAREVRQAFVAAAREAGVLRFALNRGSLTAERQEFAL